MNSVLNILKGIENDTQRRDSLHAIINGLPDPNYATLRALVLVSRYFRVLRSSADTSRVAFESGPRTFKQ
jgi:hypothetical protein